MSSVIRDGTAAPRPALPPNAELEERLSGSPLLVALDIDGTLAPIAPTPDSAAIPPATRDLLTRLTSAPNVHLALVTGRAAANGRGLVDVANSWTIGNHGIEVIDPDGALRVNSAAESFAPRIARATKMLREPLSRFDGVFIEDKHWTLSVHFRLARESDVPNVERIVREVGGELELRVLVGKKIYELRPPLAISKGTALLELAGAVGVTRNEAVKGSLLYAGDDQTDEEAFRVLPAPPTPVVTIHVGSAELPNGDRTNAEFLLADPYAMQEFLGWLLSIRGPA